MMHAKFRAASSSEAKLWRLSPRPSFCDLFGGGTAMIDEAPTAPSGSTKRYWSAAKLAVVLRTTLRAIYARMQRGGLPKPRRIGRRLLWSRKEVVAWIE